MQERMREDLALKGLSPKTCQSYIWAVRRFVKWHMRSPTLMGEAEVRQYLLYLRNERKASPALMKLTLAGIKFLYRATLHRPEVVAALPWPKVPRRLPEVLTEFEVAALLDATDQRRLRTMLRVGYAAGLRISEVCRLQIADIDSARGVLRVIGKGDQERETVLSPALLAELRDWYRWARPGKTWLFPGRTADGHVGLSTVHAGLRNAVEQAGITRHVSFHGLRHAFATHLLERGVELCVIQHMLGHKSLRTTGLYAQVRTDLLARTPDLLAALPARGQ